MTENDAGTPRDPQPETAPTQPLPEPSHSAEQPQASGNPHEPAGAVPQYVYAPTPPKNDLAVWSLITGILSYVMCPLLFGVAAIVTGTMSRKAADEGLANNRGMGTAGLILGWINVAMSLLAIIFFIVLVGVGLLAGGIGSMSHMTY